MLTADAELYCYGNNYETEMMKGKGKRGKGTGREMKARFDVFV